MCAVRIDVSRMALAALSVLVMVLTAQAAIFADGNDRHYVDDLRAKEPAGLTPEEKAILAAANNVGIIRVCDNRRSGNAFFVRYGGRPAVVTSGHVLVDTRTGVIHCDAETRTKAFYFANASHYEPGIKDKTFVLERSGLVYPPINLSEITARKFDMASPADWLVFLLDTDIAGDTMPDGRKRGVLNASVEHAPSGKLVMIGIDPDMANADRTVFQQDCDYLVKGGLVLHNCDTVSGASGSFLGVYEDGEIRIRGIHNYAPLGDEELPFALTEIDGLWNGGALIETILADADKPHPAFFAYDIQLGLSRAGCYSGKLDNQWGPGSRKALAAFATAAGVMLPGAEPDAELLAAITNAVPEGTKPCRP